MRRKATVAVMADGDDAKSTDLSRAQENAHLQDNDFVGSVKRLALTARRTAQALHGVPYLQGAPSIITKLRSEVYALAAILSSLEIDLLLESVPTATGQKYMWTSEHHENLQRSMQECEDVLRATCRAVRIADEGFRLSQSAKKEDDYIDHFQLDNGPEALDTTAGCFRLVSQTKVIVQHTTLARTESL